MSQYLQAFFVHLNLQIRSKHVGKTSNILLAWQSLLLCSNQKFCMAISTSKGISQTMRCMNRMVFWGICNQTEMVYKPSMHFLFFNMPKLPEGSGDFQGMNELIQLNAVVVSSSVPMRLGWPALDWCKESVCAERSLLSVPRGESHSHSLPFSSYCNPPFSANFHNPWSDSFAMTLSNWTITSLRPLPVH